MLQNHFKNPITNQKIASYLYKEKIRGDEFIISGAAAELYQAFLVYLKNKKALTKFNRSLEVVQESILGQLELAQQWLFAFSADSNKEVIMEAAFLLVSNKFDEKDIVSTKTNTAIEGLIGEHSSFSNGKMDLDFHHFMNKLTHFEQETVKQHEEYTRTKKQFAAQRKKALKLQEFQPRVLSSFVRNKLIDQIYLPLLGDNLAKQLGTAGANTRTDRMGLLLLISPPGYGKTTLMEYIANRLGLIFMKINAPALGHQVTSLDPGDAPNRAAAQELEKLNLAFEMGDNVMIYVDDIQHSHPEFLQKFISLCDAQRKIEGIWQGRTKTYDFRGKKVAIVMAGNPYTESGTKFKIPDMLANRADIYNLGDIIGDSEKVFKMSYLENALTSNPTLSRLSNKSMKDVYTLIQMAEDGQREDIQLESDHSASDLNEYLNVLSKLLRIRDVILAVNKEYIRSAAINDDYRTEPAFKLQGSYRNMNKLAEKVVSIMNAEELERLILSHYEGEVQTLTSNAEANFLKLKKIMGALSKEESNRWTAIITKFQKNQNIRGLGQDNPMSQMVAQIHRFSDGIEGIRDALAKD